MSGIPPILVFFGNCTAGLLYETGAYPDIKLLTAVVYMFISFVERLIDFNLVEVLHKFSSTAKNVYYVELSKCDRLEIYEYLEKLHSNKI